MPFAKTNNFPEVWEDVIRREIFEHPELREKYDCLRADDIFDNRAIIDDIVRLIRQADVIIADLTTRNPNVLYELGRAHEMGKECVLLTQDIEDVPFDLRHLRVIVYSTSGRGLATLRGQLLGTVRTIEGRLAPPGSNEKPQQFTPLGFRLPGHLIYDKVVLMPGPKDPRAVTPSRVRPKSKKLPVPTAADDWVRVVSYEIEDKVLQAFVVEQFRRALSVPDHVPVEAKIEWSDDGSMMEDIVASAKGYDEVVYDHLAISAELLPSLAKTLFEDAKLPFQIAEDLKTEEQYYKNCFTLKIAIQDKLPDLSNPSDAWLAGLLRANDEDVRSDAALDLEAGGSADVVPFLEAFVAKNRPNKSRRDVALAIRAIATIKDREKNPAKNRRTNKPG